jgi:hypothetical protein
MKLTTINQAKHIFWVKTLASGKRVISLLIQLNYLAILVLILLGKMTLTWLFLAFLVISIIALLIIEGLIPVAPVQTTIDFGGKNG